MQGHGREQAEAAPSTARCDECQVTTRWLGFYRVWQGSGEVFDTVDLFLPDVQFNTQVPSAHPLLFLCCTRAPCHICAILLRMACSWAHQKLHTTTWQWKSYEHS